MAKLSVLKDTQSVTQDSRAVKLTVKDIPIGDIQIKMNIRKDYTDIDELAESIRQYGLIQPITVYYVKDGYVVKFGHRRFLAYKKLYQENPEKYHSIRCILSDAQNIEIVQLIENVQRVDLSQLDLFNTLTKLREQGMTLRQIAEVTGKREGYIKNLFVGVNEINRNEDLQDMISHAGVTIQDIAETNSVTDKPVRMKILNDKKAGKITRAGLREKVKELANPKPKDAKPPAPVGKGNPNQTNIDYKALFELWADFGDEKPPKGVTKIIREKGLGQMDSVSFSAFCYGYEKAVQSVEARK